jgi:hypothetical protein
MSTNVPTFSNVAELDSAGREIVMIYWRGITPGKQNMHAG